MPSLFQYVHRSSIVCECEREKKIVFVSFERSLRRFFISLSIFVMYKTHISWKSNKTSPLSPPKKFPLFLKMFLRTFWSLWHTMCDSYILYMQKRGVKSKIWISNGTKMILLTHSYTIHIEQCKYSNILPYARTKYRVHLHRDIYSTFFWNLIFRDDFITLRR